MNVVGSERARIALPPNWMRGLHFLIIATYAASFFFVGIRMPREADDLPSLQIALMGWLGPLQLQFAWYANPFLLAAFRHGAVGSLRESLRYSLIAAALSASTITLFTHGVMMNVAPTYIKAANLGLGGYLWFVSILSSAVWSAYAMRISCRSSPALTSPGS